MLEAEVTIGSETSAAKKEAECTVFNEFRLKDQDLGGKHKQFQFQNSERIVMFN